MPNFRVTIHQYVKETTKVIVESATEDDAREKVEKMWSNGEIDNWDTGDIDAYHSPDIEDVRELSDMLEEAVTAIVGVSRGASPSLTYSEFLNIMIHSNLRHNFEEKTFLDAMYPAWKQLQAEREQANG